MSGEFERRWENRRQRVRTAGDEARESYYGLPVIHKAHWDAYIIVYFFVGGISGAANTIASLARLAGGKDSESITRIGRYLSTAMLVPSVVCLILDLKKPERFLNMLRIVKLRSPMSVGTWILVTSSFFMGLLTADQARKDGLLGRSNMMTRTLQRLPMRLIDVLGIIPSLFLAGYTGVLLAATAVPLWTKNHLLMGPLFLASAFSNAAAAIALIMGLKRNDVSDAKHRVERLDVAAMMAELSLLVAFKSGLTRTEAAPIETGRIGKVNRFGVLVGGIGFPLLLHGASMLRGKHSPRLISILASTAVLIGGYLFRYVMVIAGHKSADDPKATFEMTRKR
ncbi:MAG: NrfD/PsrC family molybdoenzyme membrane anchor subunit [Thermomicrobiaceae bacterium]